MQSVQTSQWLRTVGWLAICCILLAMVSPLLIAPMIAAAGCVVLAMSPWRRLSPVLVCSVRPTLNRTASRFKRKRSRRRRRTAGGGGACAAASPARRKRRPSFSTQAELLEERQMLTVLIVGNGEQYEDIQSAVTAAARGDVIELKAQTFNENVDLTGKQGLLIRGAGIGQTIVDGGGQGPVFRIENSQGIVLQNMTIRNGKGNGFHGGGVQVIRSLAYIYNNEISDNCAPISGGGVTVIGAGAHAEIVGNHIHGNTAARGCNTFGGFGGGVFIADAGSAWIESNVIEGNDAWNNGGAIYAGARTDGGGSVGAPGRIVVRDNVIFANTADREPAVFLALSNSPVRISHNTIYSQSTAINASGSGELSITNNTLDGNNVGVDLAGIAADIRNNIITNNATAGIRTNQTSDPPKFEYNDVWNNGADYVNALPGTGALSVDPQFVDRANRIYRLQPTSPAIDAGDPDPRYTDRPAGDRNDMGYQGGRGPQQLAAEYEDFFVAGAQATVKYFLSAESMNLLAGVPHAFLARGWRQFFANGSWQFEEDPPRGFGSHSNTNEWTGAWASLLLMDARGYLTAAQRTQALDILGKGLNTMRSLQTSGDNTKYVDGSFHRTLLTVVPAEGDRDRTPQEIRYNGENKQSSDDNALAYVNLRVIEGLVQQAAIDEADRQQLLMLIDDIIGDINLRRFVDFDRGVIVHEINDGQQSGIFWDRRGGAEGGLILAALLDSGQISIEEFHRLADSLQSNPVDWQSHIRGTLTIDEPNFHGGSFMMALMAMHSAPISPAQANVNYSAASLRPFVQAQGDFNRRWGFLVPWSQVMTGQLHEIRLVCAANTLPGNSENCEQGRFPGNESGFVPEWPTTLTRASGPHAFYTALVGWRDLDARDVDMLFRAAVAYQADFFDADFGWDAAIPPLPGDERFTWTAPDGSVYYSDWGDQKEALNAFYIAAALFDVTGAPISTVTTSHDRLQDIFEYLANGTPLDRTKFETTGTLNAELSHTQVAENAGGSVVTGRVTRTSSDTSRALTVFLGSSDETEATVPESVTVLAGESFADFSITIQDDDLLDGDVAVTINASNLPAGYDQATAVLNVLDHEILAASVSVDRFAEDAGTAVSTLIIERFDQTLPAITVNILNGGSSEASVAATVEFAAGQTRAEIPIDAVDDKRLDGPQLVTLAASHTQYVDDTTLVTVDDAEQLTVVLADDTISEFGGTTTAVITRSNTDDLSQATTGTFTSNDIGEAAPVQTPFTIEAGQQSVEAIVNGVDDDRLDGEQQVVLTAQADGFADGAATLTVTDYEQLVVEVAPQQVREDAVNPAAVVTVTLPNSDNVDALIVQLLVANGGKLDVAETVEIPASGDSAEVPVSVIDNAIVDDDVIATFTARAAGYVDGTATLQIVDDESLAYPDLQGESFNVVAAQPFFGDWIDVEYDIRNDGDAAATSFDVRFFVSGDETVDATDVLLRTSTIDPLAAGATTGVQTVSLKLPNENDAFWDGDGNYTIGIIIDPADELREHDEADNANTGDGLDRETVPMIRRVPPQAPTLRQPLLQSVNVTPTVVWDAVADVTYELRVRNYHTGQVVRSASGLTATEWTPVEGLTVGEYVIAVQSVNAAGGSAWSELDLDIVAPPANLITGPTPFPGVSRPVFTWDSVRPSDSDDAPYTLELLVYDKTAGQLVRRVTDLTASAWVTDIDLLDGTYQAFTRGVNPLGEAGAWAGPWEIIIDTGNPDVGRATPTGPAGNLVPDSTPDITWRAVVDAVSYNVQVYDFARGALVSEVSNHEGLWWTAPELELHRVFNVHVQANFADGSATVWAGPLQFTVHRIAPLLPSTEFIAPVDPVVTPTPTFRWKGLAGSTDYQYEIYSVTRGQRIAFGTTGGRRSLTLNPLAADDYQLFIRGVTAGGEPGSWSKLEFQVAIGESFELRQASDEAQPLSNPLASATTVSRTAGAEPIDESHSITLNEVFRDWPQADDAWGLAAADTSQSSESSLPASGWLGIVAIGVLRAGLPRRIRCDRVERNRGRGAACAQ